MRPVLAVCVILLQLTPGPGASPFGPKYPITATWFRDRPTYLEWNRTLAEFQAQGGDTAFLRAPPIVRRSREELARDPNLRWCGSTNSSTGATGTPCYDEAVTQLQALGLNVTAFVTYQYEEGFSDAIMLCPNVDRKINSSRVYYRIVLPAGEFDENKVCDFAKGTEVVVLLTSFAGADTHSLLLQAATDRNMSVYFGLPAAPVIPGPSQSQHARHSRDPFRQDAAFDTPLMGAYYGWVYRVLREHQARYSKVTVKAAGRSHRSPKTGGSPRSVYNKTLVGYYSGDESCLAQETESSPVVSLYSQLGRLVHGRGKKLAVSPSIALNTLTANASVLQHVNGFHAIAATGQVDVVAVQEGRGYGRGAYYWSTQASRPIGQLDRKLDQVLRYIHPQLHANATFRDVFTASNQELFAALGRSRDGLARGTGGVELWLVVEAFEYLRDDPCTPADPALSGLGQMVDRADKARVDRGLAAASGTVQKVMASPWDPSFTCSTRRQRASLAAQVRSEVGRPLVVNCFFHSPANRSVVVIGYNMEGMRQGFQVNWPARGKRCITNLYGYYFELDWGVRHHRIPSLEYTQLYDPPNLLTDLDPKGWVSVKALQSPEVCIFQYDFSRSSL